MGVHAQDAHENQGIDELVGMGCGDNEYRSLLWDFPGASRMNLAEEELDDD